MKNAKGLLNFKNNSNSYILNNFCFEKKLFFNILGNYCKMKSMQKIIKITIDLYKKRNCFILH